MRTLNAFLLLCLLPLIGSCGSSQRPVLLDIGAFGHPSDLALQLAMADERVLETVGRNMTVTETASSHLSSNSGILFWRPERQDMFRSFLLAGDQGSGSLIINLQLRNRVWHLNKLEFEEESLLKRTKGGER